MIKKRCNINLDRYSKLSQLSVIIFLFFFSPIFANSKFIDDSFSEDSILLGRHFVDYPRHFSDVIYIGDSTIISGLQNIYTSEDFVKTKTSHSLERRLERKTAVLKIKADVVNELKRKESLKDKQNSKNYSFEDEFHCNIPDINNLKASALLLRSNYEYAAPILSFEKFFYALFTINTFLKNNYHSIESYNSTRLKILGSRAPPMLF